ncbi:MAG: adenylate/guanylate cyclase domain-containing protein [Burkholderiaceae bacterium]|nr:MAG: adenylate/guanylate cyclase domain-containing protein [Burkholderiaceae bacterium]
MRCASCLTDNPDGNLFCGHCGASLRLLGHGAGRTGGATRATAPLPPKWGELKIATIFFADIVSSTTHIAGLDAEQAMEQLQPAVQRMCEAVEVLGGTVVRTMGDGILALFGVPHTVEGHARLACEAALKLQKAFSGNQLGLQLRVGLHSGQVASDPQAFDSNIGGGVHGSAIHLASRVVGVAEPGGICLSADCLALTGGACEVRAMGPHKLKGIAKPTEIYALVRVKSDAPDQHFHRAVLSPFHGRTDELVTLQNALHRTEQGQCAVIGLSGAAGAGKSRLCFEFAQWCRARLVPVTEARTQLYGYATPLAPVLALLRGWFFHMAPADDDAAARGRIKTRLSRLGVSASDDLALFNEFLGVADPDGMPCALAPKARRARLLALFGDMVRYTGATTSVIVFEDLHWLDEASAEFLDVLVQSVPGTRTLLLFNYRPTYKAHWSALPHFHEIHLAELGAADTEALVRELAGPHPQWQDAFALIVQRSAGNPFFVEELVRLLLEGGILPGAPGPHDLASRVRALPATVQAVIGARIDRLGATQKAVLHICAVIGKEIPLPVLQRVARYLAGQIDREMDFLCEAELLEFLREIVGERYFGFHHPLIQEVAYNTQLRARRASLHAAVAAAMEAHYSAEPDEYAALLAFHYQAAGQPVQAARHLSRAAQWLGATHSTQAMKHWRHARELLADQPRAPDTDRLRVKVGGGLLQLGWREGLDAAELNQVVDEAVAHASEADRGWVQSILVTQGRILHGNGGSADDYVNTVRRAIELGSSNPGRAALLQVTLSQAYSWAGLSHEALAASDQAVPDIAAVEAAERAALGFNPERWRLALRARVLMRMLRLGEAEDCLRRMEQIGADGEDPVINQIALHCKIEIAWCRRDPDQAQRYAQASADAVRAGSNPYLRATGKWFDGIAALLVHDPVRANCSFVEALELIRTTRVAVDIEDELLAWSAECRALADDTRGALDQARQAVELARQRCHRIPECRGLIVWGSVCAKDGSDGAKLAARLFERAKQLIAQTGAAICEDGLRRGRALLAPPA